MRIKRYVAPSVQEAVERVRREMGPEALILQTRRVWRWWMPWRRPSVEVLAAWEPASGPRRRAPQASAPAAGRSPSTAPAPAGSRRGGPGPSAGPAPGSASGPTSPAALRSERERAAPLQTYWFERLVEQDVDASLAWSLVEKASVLAASARMDFPEALAWQIGSSVQVLPLWERTSRQRVVMLVGPTGVGKTTTVAKLAANFALVGGWKVGLVTADTFRIGAIQQLRTYAELMGVSLDVAQDGGALREVISASDRELLLIDTTGHRPGDPERLAEVLELCSALPQDADVLLVVPASLRQADLADVIAAYRPLPLTGVCVTKVDETRRRGALINAPHWAGRPLAFVTTGQAVPDDIEAAEPEVIVRWLLSGAEGRSGESPENTSRKGGLGLARSGGRPAPADRTPAGQ